MSQIFDVLDFLKQLESQPTSALGVALLAKTKTNGAYVSDFNSTEFMSQPNRGNYMAKKAFISFDYDNDEVVKHFLAGQAKNPDSPFDFYDHSVKEHLSGDWEAKVRARIQRADLAIVLCGQYTHHARGVATELAIAQSLGKPYFLLAAYSDKICTKPTTATQYDKVYNWTWPNLRALIQGGR